MDSQGSQGRDQIFMLATLGLGLCLPRLSIERNRKSVLAHTATHDLLALGHHGRVEVGPSVGRIPERFWERSRMKQLIEAGDADAQDLAKLGHADESLSHASTPSLVGIRSL